MRRGFLSWHQVLYLVLEEHRTRCARVARRVIRSAGAPTRPAPPHVTLKTDSKNKIASVLFFDESRIFNLISLFVKIGLQRHREADPDKEGNPVEISVFQPEVYGEGD